MINERVALEAELSKFKSCLEKLTKDYDLLSSNANESQNIEDLIKEKEKVHDLEKKIKSKNREIEEVKSQIAAIEEKNGLLEEETKYFKTYAKTLKAHADQAMKDVEFYRSKLNMN